MKNGILQGTPAGLLSSEEQEVVRRQLAYIMASPLFRHSKRFPDFLRYTVEEALGGRFEQLKERTLGVEVFGRDPDYDTNSDPVVRMTAVAVRKRLAQYYQLPGHETELRIEFPRGSYVPEFKFAKEVVHEPAVESVSVTAIPVARKPGQWPYWVAVLALSCAAIFLLAWKRHPAAHESSFDRFWAPIVSSSAPVLVCIPDLTATIPAAARGSSTASPNPLASALGALPPSFRRNRVTFGDSFAASILTNVLGRADRSFRLRRANDANLQDLEEGPVVLIGGRSSNQWSQKLDNELRFGAIHEGSLHYVSDRQNPSSQQWSVTRTPDQTDSAMTTDYAIISRVNDMTTGHPLLTTAGLFQYGTEAAAMCLSEPSCLASAEEMAPGDWQHKNIQIVIQTTIINDSAGEPRAVAAYIW
ncbi:MAG TPA: hypothetical protein VIY69_16550 [Candidatus Acidoferrales bacterium]